VGDRSALRSERLILRRWRPEDREPFAALNADPAVMEHFPATLSREESDALADRIEAELDEVGWGLWAVEVAGGTPFIGFVGVHRVAFEAPFTPAVEVGWRIAHEHWGKGYATEAAAVSVRHGLSRGIEEIVSFTSVGNQRSRAVMQRLGMIHDPADDFDHPKLPVGHRLRRHVLYRFPSRPAH
jgi:RimJ/RimL family protein N-acetyltransferase